MSLQSAAPFDPSADPMIGQTLKGTYRILRGIAVGGMGTIYEAEHVRLHRRVAVKIVSPQGAGDARYAERFEREVDAIARLGHPHIVHVLDFDRMDSGAPYLVMEYLDGTTLEAEIDRSHRLPVHVALDITSQVAAALAEVHAHGIVHRDLKPANVFLVHAAGEPQFVKLLDFGVSQASGRRRLTSAREIVGTPEYMAPEQAQAKPQDARVDQFALAAITYEMLTGRQAFDAEELTAVLRQVLMEDPPRVSEIAPWVPDVIDAVVARALSKDPDERFPSISQFAFALESAAARAGIVRERASLMPEPAARPSAPPQPMPRATPTADRPTSVRATPTSTPPPSQSGHNPEATALFVAARRARDAGDLNDAVARAEELLELAAYEKDPGVLGVLARAMPVLDDVFERYVGPLGACIAAGPAYDSVRSMALSPRAAELLARLDRPTPIRDVFSHARVPTRAGLRLIAGLMRRRVVQRV